MEIPEADGEIEKVSVPVPPVAVNAVDESARLYVVEIFEPAVKVIPLFITSVITNRAVAPVVSVTTMVS